MRFAPRESYPLRARAGICGTSVGQALPNVGPLEDDDTHAVDRRVALTQLRSIPRTGPARLHASGGGLQDSDRAAAANTRKLLFGSGLHQRRSEPDFLESRFSEGAHGDNFPAGDNFRAQNECSASGPLA